MEPHVQRERVRGEEVAESSREFVPNAITNARAGQKKTLRKIGDRPIQAKRTIE